MNSRRKFIKKIGATALSAYAIHTSPAFASEVHTDPYTEEENAMIIGIIGAENTHTVAYGKLFNIDKNFPGVEVRFVWGETDEFARHAMQAGAIPHMVQEPEEMLGNIDALIVDHRHDSCLHKRNACYPDIQ